VVEPVLEDRSDVTKKQNEVMRDVLNILSHIHDSNPSNAMADVPDLEYARHMLGQARCVARAALAHLYKTMK
jgi:hypothetical protein